MEVNNTKNEIVLKNDGVKKKTWRKKKKNFNKKSKIIEGMEAFLDDTKAQPKSQVQVINNDSAASSSTSIVNEPNTVSLPVEVTNASMIQLFDKNSPSEDSIVNQDQWSPLNPEGKKQYDRDFLLQLQTAPLCLRKPRNMPNLDIIRDKPRIQIMQVYGNVSISMHPARPLKRSVPQHAQSGNVRGTNLCRKIRGILNKLTFVNFRTLVKQMKELPIDTMQKLEECVKLIFEKAVAEPCLLYAFMCQELALIKVPLDDGQGVVNFRKLLLTKCHKELEKNQSTEKKREDKIKPMKGAEDNKENFKELQIEEEKKKMKVRHFGIIRFMGELFKVNMIIEPIMHECIKKLLAQGDEESLKCLCLLLRSVGEKLDKKKNKARNNNLMDSYFTAMQRNADKRLTSSRIRFMLQDVIDLRNNCWSPKRDENNEKYTDQIQIGNHTFEAPTDTQMDSCPERSTQLSINENPVNSSLCYVNLQLVNEVNKNVEVKSEN